MTSRNTTTGDLGADPRQLLAASLSRPLTAVEQASLDAWAASSPAAREEVAETREIWLTAGLAADDPVMLGLRRSARQIAGLDRPVVRKRGGPSRRWWAGGLGLAAAVVAGVLLIDLPRTETFTAPPRATSRVTLADGSHVTLSPGGRLTARLSRRARVLALSNGDAFFDVSHDRHRPFSVAVSGRMLTVLGTRFNVAGGRRLTVSLVQGSLKVSRANAPDVLLRPGERYVDAEGAAGRAEPGDVLGDAAWTDGRLVFADTSLAEAAERLSRAAGRRVVLADPSLGDLRLSGSVRVARMDDVRAVLEASLPVTTRLTASGDLLISRARDSSLHG